MAYGEKRGKSEYPWRVKYLKPDGNEGSKSGFRTKKAAEDWGNEQEADIRRGTWLDPERGAITLDAYHAKWMPAQDLSDSTVDRYDSYYRTHLSPKWGAVALRDIDPLDVAAFEKHLRAARASATADGVMMVLRMMMADAVYEKRLAASPVQPRRRRGKRTAPTARKGVATTLEALDAIRARLPAPEALMALCAAFTGMRWGEVIGLRRSFLMLIPADGDVPASGWYDIDEKIGAVHEDKGGRRDFGPPKNRRGRTVELPSFLVALLLAHLETIPAKRDLLFVDGANNPHRRSNFDRRLWRPACDGWPVRETSRGHPGREAAPPIVQGLHFHDLRHTQETWLTEDGIPRIARDERLGHATPGMEGVYGHVTPAMRAEVLACLARRWERPRVPLKS
jgi:integrase